MSSDRFRQTEKQREFASADSGRERERERLRECVDWLAKMRKLIWMRNQQLGKSSVCSRISNREVINWGLPQIAKRRNNWPLCTMYKTMTYTRRSTSTTTPPSTTSTTAAAARKFKKQVQNRKRRDKRDIEVIEFLTISLLWQRPSRSRACLSLHLFLPYTALISVFNSQMALLGF